MTDNRTPGTRDTEWIYACSHDGCNHRGKAPQGVVIQCKKHPGETKGGVS